MDGPKKVGGWNCVYLPKKGARLSIVIFCFIMSRVIMMSNLKLAWKSKVVLDIYLNVYQRFTWKDKKQLFFSKKR